MSKVAYQQNIWGGTQPDSSVTIHSTAYSVGTTGNDFVEIDASLIFLEAGDDITLSSDNIILSADIFLDGTVIGPVSISGTFSQADGFAYLGQVNSQDYPDTGIGTALSWNFTGGGGEVDIWNLYSGGAPASFQFKQMTGTGAADTVATIYADGRVAANSFTAGTITGQVTQLELIETGLASSSGQGQVKFDRTEANTPGSGEEAHIYIGNHRTGGTGTRVAVQQQIDTTVGGSSQFIVGWNGLAWAKKDGAAYALDAFCGIFTAKVDAALPNVAAVAIEADINVLGNVGRKIAIQIIDEATSVGAGTSYDAGIVIGKQAGGRGFNYGLQFGFDLAAAASELNNAFLYSPNGTIPYGIDFSGVTFSTAAWKGDFTATGYVGTGTVTVASLPTAAAGNKGYRAMVSNSNATMTAGIGAVVAGGGANVVPVYSDGANWRIG